MSSKKNEDCIKGSDVIRLIYEGQSQNKPGKKAAGTRLLKRFVEQQTKLGKSAIMVEAGIRSHVTKLHNNS